MQRLNINPPTCRKQKFSFHHSWLNFISTNNKLLSAVAYLFYSVTGCERSSVWLGFGLWFRLKRLKINK